MGRDVVDDCADRRPHMGRPVFGEIGLMIRRVNTATRKETSENFELRPNLFWRNGDKRLDISKVFGGTDVGLGTFP